MKQEQSSLNYQVPKISVPDTIRTIFRRRILIISVVVFTLLTIILFIAQFFIVLPAFHDLQIQNIQSEAIRTARHLSNSYVLSKEKLPNFTITDETRKGLEEVQHNFSLTKIKLFKKDGTIAFSTAKSEEGRKNTHSYFQNSVAKGEVYSKIVEKNTKTSEGVTSHISVAEVYVPIMAEQHFLGAFEIYYDITSQNTAINRNELFFKSLGLATWFILCTLFLVLISRSATAFATVDKVQSRLQSTNMDLESRVAEQTRELEATQKSSIIALASLAEYYDTSTGEHLDKIQQYVKILLDHLPDSGELTEQHKKQIVLASVIHDAGKTAVSSDILTKPGALTRDEFESVQFHTVAGGDAFLKAKTTFHLLFDKESYLDYALEIARHHHEKWDGSGYPDGLQGNDIPLAARIVAIADVYDALTSKRPYKEPWPHQKACKVILQESGHHFDPALIEVFNNCSDQFASTVPSSTRDTI